MGGLVGTPPQRGYGGWEEGLWKKQGGSTGFLVQLAWP